MSSENKIGSVQRGFLLFVGVGVWLPIIGAALMAAMVVNGDRSFESSWAYASIFVFLGAVEIGSALLLFVYAVCYRPWRIPGKAHDKYLIHVFGVIVSFIVTALLFVG